jgi:hypothetical protein
LIAASAQQNACSLSDLSVRVHKPNAWIVGLQQGLQNRVMGCATAETKVYIVLVKEERVERRMKRRRKKKEERRKKKEEWREEEKNDEKKNGEKKGEWREEEKKEENSYLFSLPRWLLRALWWASRPWGTAGLSLSWERERQSEKWKECLLRCFEEMFGNHRGNEDGDAPFAASAVLK